MGNENKERSGKRTNSPISPCEPGVPKWPEVPGIPFSPYHMIENRDQLMRMRIYSTFQASQFGNTEKKAIKFTIFEFL